MPRHTTPLMSLWRSPPEHSDCGGRLRPAISPISRSVAGKRTLGLGRYSVLLARSLATEPPSGAHSEGGNRRIVRIRHLGGRFWPNFMSHRDAETQSHKAKSHRVSEPHRQKDTERQSRNATEPQRRRAREPESQRRRAAEEHRDADPQSRGAAEPQRHAHTRMHAFTQPSARRELLASPRQHRPLASKSQMNSSSAQQERTQTTPHGANERTRRPISD